MGWVVQNFYISSEIMNEGVYYNEYRFQLRDGPLSGVNVESLDAWIGFGSEPTDDPQTGDSDEYLVGDSDGYLEGDHFEIVELLPIEFIIGYPTEICEQDNHPNVQAAKNQCAPASVANSLQYLENEYPSDVTITHDNIPGYGASLSGIPYPSNSLVAHLDVAMERKNVRGRFLGDGVNAYQWLEGKLKYLDDNGLDFLVVKHQGEIDHDVSIGNAASEYMGDPSFEFIKDQICAGNNVEVGLEWPNSRRHAVEVTAAGYILGIPFIKHLSDLKQAHNDKTDTLGCNTEHTDYLYDDGNGNIKVIGGDSPKDTQIAFITTQSTFRPSLIVEIPRFSFPHLVPIINIKNVGWNNPPTDPIKIQIDLDGLVLVGSGYTTEFQIPEPGDEIEIRGGFVMGLGAATLLATVEYDDEIVGQNSANTFLLGPFIWVRE